MIEQINKMPENIEFKAKILNMGAKTIIIVPTSMRDMIKKYKLQDDFVRVTVEKYEDKDAKS
jgi:hypothetical protein